ncbi:MAG TPA: O-acetyl-ADP-ribose deacetylase [Nocardioidaceae bacterium]|nr:O-acetyl-ADP-ribose deacetylase [Nocardioidaceae bacterium]
MQMTVLEADITTLPVDAVVNAANSAMRGGGGVDGAIHRAAGPSLLQECVRRFPDGLPTGSAGWTGAGAMPSRWVIHVVGPDRRAGQTDPELLASCYREALRVADELGATSVAFPMVSAGVYGWDPAQASRVAVRALRETSTHVGKVCLVAFDADAARTWRDALAGDG